MDIISDPSFAPPSRAPSPKLPSVHTTATSSSSKPGDENAVVLNDDDAVVPVQTTTTGNETGAKALEKEVGEVVNQLSTWGNSFWGGFKKQVCHLFGSNPCLRC